MRLSLFRKHRHHESSNNHSKGIFRGGRKAARRQEPTIQPAITWTLSDEAEEEAACLKERMAPLVIQSHAAVSIQSPKVQKISSYVFTEQELMVNELNHVRQLAEKQQQISKMQVVNEELRQALEQKEKELADSRKRLVTTAKKLGSVQCEKVAMQVELAETKGMLNRLGSTLIQNQHELHELKEESKRNFLGILW
jgi:chromosome segregation ATPase